MPSYVETCEKAVRAAGQVLLDWFGRVSVREKGQADLVTEADQAAQEVVRQTVLAAFPEHAVVGEEDGPAEIAARPRAEFRWIVDPLDGTTNYVHRVPCFSVSLALERRGRLLLGAVYDPLRDECFLAEARRGASLNGHEIHTSGVTTLRNALAAVGLPAVVRPDCVELRVLLEAVQVCQSIRRTGSAALNLAYLAAGRFDVVWSLSTKLWDVAAGVLLIQEAGGEVISPDGGDVVPDTGRVLAAANRPLLEELQTLMCRAGV